MGARHPRLIPEILACSGRSPHGFIEQEDDVAAGIARLVGGGES